MDASSVGIIVSIVTVVTLIGNLAVLGAALAVAILCTRRRLCLPAAWLLFGAAALAFVAGLASRLFYQMGYAWFVNAWGQAGADAIGLGLEAFDFAALVLIGVAILLFRPARTAAIPEGEVAHG